MLHVFTFVGECEFGGEWNDGVDYWSGALDWTTGVPRPQIGCVLVQMLSILRTMCVGQGSLI